jgi:hypothetical protein
MNEQFHLMSNYTEFATVDTRTEAKVLAKRESMRYDDVVTIEHKGQKIYMAQYGTLYTLRVTR